MSCRRRRPMSVRPSRVPSRRRRRRPSFVRLSRRPSLGEPAFRQASVLGVATLIHV